MIAASSTDQAPDGLPSPARLLGLAVALLSLTACAHAPYTDRLQLMTVSEDSERAFGAAAYQTMLSNLPVSRDPVLNAVLLEVGERLAAVAARPDYQWEFALLEDPQANAFALPGGKVAVCTGLIPIAKDSGGLAAVLAHEIAHALARHGAERLSQSHLIEALTGAATSAVPVPGLDIVAALALGVGVRVGYELPFSRAQESEADRIGLILMAKAGYDPNQALELWQRFEAAEGTSRIEFLSTHPNPGKRREDLVTWLPEAQAYFAAAVPPAPMRELATIAADR